MEQTMDYSERELDDIFYSAPAVPGMPGYVYDCDGEVICRYDYGKYTTYGWHVDHDPPLAIAGLFGDRGVLRPRHWLGNTSAGGSLGNLMKALAPKPSGGIAAALKKRGIF
jgi:hypothetical protein